MAHRNKKKILHYYKGPLAGATRMLLQSQVVMDDYRVSILSYSGVKSEVSEEWKNVDIFHVPIISSTFQTPVKMRLFRKLIRLLNHVKILWLIVRAKADLIHTHQHSSLVLSLFWVLIVRRPLIYDPHDMPLHDPKLKRYYRFKRLIEKIVVSRAKVVLAVSEGMRQLYQSIYPNTEVCLVRSLPPIECGKKSRYKNIHSINKLEDTKDIFPNQSIRLIYAGLIKPPRLPLKMINTLGSIKAIQLDIYGYDTAGYDRKIFKHLKEEKINNIRIVGSYSPDNIINIMGEYHFCLLPYFVNELNITYCMPNKFYQSLLAGLPFIVSDMAEIGSIVRKNNVGIVFRSGDYEELKSILMSIKTDTEIYENMRKNVILLAQKIIDYDLYSKQLLNIYNTALMS